MTVRKSFKEEKIYVKNWGMSRQIQRNRRVWVTEKNLKENKISDVKMGEKIVENGKNTHDEQRRKTESRGTIKEWEQQKIT